MKDRKTSSIAWILHFATQCRGKMIVSVILAILGSASGMIPYFTVSALIVQLCAGDYSLTGIIQAAFIVLVGYLGKVWLSTASTVLSHHSAFTILKNIRTALTAKLARVPMGTVLDTPSGKYKSILVDTVEKLELPLAHLIPEVTANLLIPLFMIIYLFVLDWRLALVSLITIPIGLFCYMGMMKDYQVRYSRVQESGKNMDAAIVEYIGGIEIIKAFNQSAVSYGKYATAVKESREAKASWFQKTNGYFVAGIAIMPANLLGVLPFGSWLFMHGRLDASVFISCVILSLSLVHLLIQAMEYTDSLAMVDSTVQEIAGLLQEEELNRPQKPVTLLNHTVSMSHVCFGYHGEEVLHDVSFDAVPNGMTAIVGPSGSGKSTMARLISSFWDVNSGAVLLGGIDVRKLPLSQVMDTVAYVSQDNFLFNLSIRENIRIGKPSATDFEVEEAAKRANCHDFILSLPKGYETLAGDGGGNLSGGERQRIAIARAIIKNSPVVVLDEATAFTDPESEAVIQTSLNELVRGKTLIVIAHRLGTIIGADKIIVMNNGKIQAQGIHQELLDSCSLYKTLWTAYTSARDTREEEK